MPEAHDPRDVPFAVLHLPIMPLAPRPGFHLELRDRIETALNPTEPSAALSSHAPQGSAIEPTATEETTMSNDISTDTDSTAPAASRSPLAPYLSVAGAAAAIDWYRDVLGGIETTRFVGDDGRVGHAELDLGGATIMLADEFPEIDSVGPVTRGGTTVALHLEVIDVDYTYHRAMDAGATSLREPADQGHGNRNATLVDPFGHRWMISQPIEADRAESASQETGTGGNGGSWTVTDRQPVEPGYLTVHTADLARAQAFFGTLFGWEFEVGGAGGGHVSNTRFPLGIAPPGEDATELASARPTTTIYFRVDDIEVYAQRVVELGGQVLARNDYPSGGDAQCVDDQGYQFDLWKPAPGY